MGQYILPGSKQLSVAGWKDALVHQDSRDSAIIIHSQFNSKIKKQVLAVGGKAGVLS
jgi:hypothetical protein